jgi:acetolactate synthase small subunit
VTNSAPKQSVPSGSRDIAVPLLYGLVIAVAAASIYSFVQMDRLRTELAGLRESVEVEVSKVQEASSLLSSANRRTLDALREELDSARRASAVAVGQAKSEALRHAEDIAKKLQEEQRKQQQQVSSELTAVKQAANTAHAKIADVSTEVSGVRSDVVSTRSELTRTIAELKSVRGDLGVQSGLVATNAGELAALKALGDRNYYEFKLNRSKQTQRVGDVAIRLTKVDVKKNRFTIELVADDKKVEKKDKSINEPLQFYVAKARTPYEIVVNEVGKDRIAGYLATPKVQAAR